MGFLYTRPIKIWLFWSFFMAIVCYLELSYLIPETLIPTMMKVGVFSALLAMNLANDLGIVLVVGFAILILIFKF